MVPLHLRNLMLLLAYIKLILKNYRTYIFVYLLGIGAAWAEGKSFGPSHGINGILLGVQWINHSFTF
jgi:hypothetical protein